MSISSKRPIIENIEIQHEWQREPTYNITLTDGTQDTVSGLLWERYAKSHQDLIWSTDYSSLEEVWTTVYYGLKDSGALGVRDMYVEMDGFHEYR
jgi:hypothetical protein